MTIETNNVVAVLEDWGKAESIEAMSSQANDESAAFRIHLGAANGYADLVDILIRPTFYNPFKNG